MNTAQFILLACIAATVFCGDGYPVRCKEVGDSVLGTVTDCDVSHDPLPFKWTSTIKLKKNVKWAGVDDVQYIYSNPNETVAASCSLAAPLPGAYNKNDNLTIEQTCSKYDPPLFKGANLVIMFFYTHHDSFDDVLMYTFPIPGYINAEEKPREL